jgi:hypothetical protein
VEQPPGESPGISGRAGHAGRLGSRRRCAGLQRPPPPRAPYNPRVGDSATATVINVFTHIAGGKLGFLEGYLVDVDGNSNTTDDQRIIIRAIKDLEGALANRKLFIGDKIIYTEDTNTITNNVINNSYTRTR